MLYNAPDSLPKAVQNRPHLVPSTPTPSGTNALNDSAATAGVGQAPYSHCVYGVSVRSDQPLGLPQGVSQNLAVVEMSATSEAELAALVRAAVFHPDSDDWYQYAFLADGST